MRKPGSIIRNRLVELLYFLKKSHGYELAKIYNLIFPKVSQRVIYYHLNRGVKEGIFEAIDEDVKGNYSWGNSARVVFYVLGKNAQPKADLNVKKALKHLKLL